VLFNNKVALIVDDSYTIRHQIKVLLRKYNITVFEAYDKKSMQKYFSVNNKPIDLFIMDLSLKETTGFELMDCIRHCDLHKETPIVVLTGDATKDTVIRTAQYNISFYAIKPIKSKDLSDKVLLALEHGEANTPPPTISNSDELEVALTKSLTDKETHDNITLSLIHKTK
jgi:DNA-binding response OmpR family regulator